MVDIAQAPKRKTASEVPFHLQSNAGCGASLVLQRALTGSLGPGALVSTQLVRFAKYLRNEYKLCLDPRLDRRYQLLVKSHMGISSSTSPGPNTGTDSTKAASQSQAMWRFLHNDSVAIQALIEPLKEAARDGCSCSKSQFVLIMHDWSKLDFKTHKSKKDKVQLTHKYDVGYDLTAILAVDASSGAPMAPVAM